jgi:transposase
MSKIPTQLTAKEFGRHVEPYLSKARRGFVCKIPLFKVFNYILYLMHTGCQWDRLPVAPDPNNPGKPGISPDAVYYHFRKWCRDGSLQRVWQSSIRKIRTALDLTELNLDGTHTLAKKGGQSVAYQGRKKAKTSNILPMMDKQGYVIASTEIVAGNHNDAFNLTLNLRQALHAIKCFGLNIRGSFFNADSAFDTREARKTCFNHDVIPNMPENQRNRKQTKRGRKRLFNAEVYKHRFCAERTFAWADKFKRLLIRFERKDTYFFGLHCIAFALSTCEI